MVAVPHTFRHLAGQPGQTVLGPGRLDGMVIMEARHVAERPEIYRAASWVTLVELSSPKMSSSVRQAHEGSPKRPANQPAARMAA